jgi:DNA-binding response OmpR family regulator
MMKLLIVDDNKMLVEIYTTGLSERGFEVLHSMSGAECLDLLKNEVPDVILMDIMMPGMDGWETLMQIRSNPKTEKIPVLMLTAKALTIEDINRYGGYIDGFLIKPFTLNALSDRINDFYRIRENYREIVHNAHQRCSDSAKVDEWAESGRQFYVLKKLVKVFEDEYGGILKEGAIQTGLPDTLDQIMENCRFRSKRFYDLTDELGLSDLLPDELKDDDVCRVRDF